MLKSLRCCLNPKVMGGLAVVGLLLWLVAPVSGAAALPLLFALVCPLSMGAMAWGMRRGDSCAASSPASAEGSVAAPAGVDAELRAVREELAIARARRQLTVPDEHPLP